MKKYLSLFVILFFLSNVFPDYFYIIDQSFASDSESEGEESDDEIEKQIFKKSENWHDHVHDKVLPLYWRADGKKISLRQNIAVVSVAMCEKKSKNIISYVNVPLIFVSGNFKVKGNTNSTVYKAFLGGTKKVREVYVNAEQANPKIYTDLKWMSEKDHKFTTEILPQKVREFDVQSNSSGLIPKLRLHGFRQPSFTNFDDPLKNRLKSLLLSNVKISNISDEVEEYSKDEEEFKFLRDIFIKANYFHSEQALFYCLLNYGYDYSVVKIMEREFKEFDEESHVLVINIATRRDPCTQCVRGVIDFKKRIILQTRMKLEDSVMVLASGFEGCTDHDAFDTVIAKFDLDNLNKKKSPLLYMVYGEKSSPRKEGLVIKSY